MHDRKGGKEEQKRVVRRHISIHHSPPQPNNKFTRTPPMTIHCPCEYPHPMPQNKSTPVTEMQQPQRHVCEFHPQIRSFVGRVILLFSKALVSTDRPPSVVLELARLDVARQHFALEVFLVAVPEQSCFAVERRGARKRNKNCQHYCPSFQTLPIDFDILTYSAPPTTTEYSAAHSPCSTPHSTRPPCPVRPASKYQGRCARSCRRWGGRWGF